LARCQVAWSPSPLCPGPTRPATGRSERIQIHGVWLQRPLPHKLWIACVATAAAGIDLLWTLNIKSSPRQVQRFSSGMIAGICCHSRGIRCHSRGRLQLQQPQQPLSQRQKLLELRDSGKGRDSCRDSSRKDHRNNGRLRPNHTCSRHQSCARHGHTVRPCTSRGSHTPRRPWSADPARDPNHGQKMLRRYGIESEPFNHAAPAGRRAAAGRQPPPPIRRTPLSPHAPPQPAPPSAAPLRVRVRACSVRGAGAGRAAAHWRIRRAGGRGAISDRGLFPARGRYGGRKAGARAG
jgi:hypothetical protein